MAPKQEIQLNFSKFFDAFRGESDRAAAVLGGAYVEERLRRVFRARLISAVPDDVFAWRGPLGDFAGKIDLAFALGWISSDSHYDFHIVRRIRNDFAHDVDHTLAFDTQSVKDRTQNFRGLKQLRAMIENALPADNAAQKTMQKQMLEDLFGTSRRRFEMIVATLELILAKTVADSTAPVEKIDTWKTFNLGSVTLEPGETATIDLQTSKIRKP